MDGGWTVTELVARVEQALATDGVRAPNGRIRDLPDARAIRWYTTIGLVDRPRIGRGRTARYTPRHLVQIVAVKRRQAEGYSLAEIQTELTGATTATLRAVARVPPHLLAEPATAAGPTLPAPSGAPDRPVGARFWTAPTPAPPADRTPAPASADPGKPAGPAGPAAPGSAGSAEPAGRLEPDTIEVGSVSTRYLIPLAGGAVLSLAVAPTAADAVALRAAAAPLLALLADRGLTMKELDDDSRTH